MLFPAARIPTSPVWPRGRALATATVACRQEETGFVNHPQPSRSPERWHRRRTHPEAKPEIRSQEALNQGRLCIPKPLPTEFPFRAQGLSFQLLKRSRAASESPAQKVTKTPSSGHGACSRGVCQCDAGWAGEAAVTSFSAAFFFGSLCAVDSCCADSVCAFMRLLQGFPRCSPQSRSSSRLEGTASP